MDYDLIFYHSITSDNKEYNQYGIHNIIYKNAITWNIKSFQLLKKINFPCNGYQNEDQSTKFLPEVRFVSKG